MRNRYTTFWLRLFLMSSLFFSHLAWACGTGGCTKMSDQSIPSASGFSNSSAGSMPDASSYTFSDSSPGAAVPGAGSKPAAGLAQAVQYDPARGSADFGELAKTNSQFRKVMHGEQGLSPAARLERQSIARGALAGVASDEVVRPAAYQSARAARGFSGARTISTGGE